MSWAGVNLRYRQIPFQRSQNRASPQQNLPLLGQQILEDCDISFLSKAFWITIIELLSPSGHQNDFLAS